MHYYSVWGKSFTAAGGLLCFKGRRKAVKGENLLTVRVLDRFVHRRTCCGFVTAPLP
jgi:hypothetical protein